MFMTLPGSGMILILLLNPGHLPFSSMSPYMWYVYASLATKADSFGFFSTEADEFRQTFNDFMQITDIPSKKTFYLWRKVLSLLRKDISDGYFSYM